MSKKLLFFIEGLLTGGKERRFVELLHYLKKDTDFEMMVVLTEDEIHYTYIYNLNIPIKIINRGRYKKNPSLFFRFYSLANKFKPDIIHTWGVMTTFYAIPAKILLKRPLLSSLISDSKVDFKNFSILKLVFKIDCIFSDLIVGNSNAGLNAYKINKQKKRLIYNGVRLERFNLKTDKCHIRKEFNINTPLVIIMVASVSKNKDYDLFIDVAKHLISLRNDVTFLGVGDGSEFNRIMGRIENEKITNVIFTGKRNDVESIVAIADIGILISNSEGISNSIIEYMAMGKPVITTDLVGGSREIIENDESGYLVKNQVFQIAEKLIKLLDDKNLRQRMGKRGTDIIRDKFTIETMGQNFVKVYNEL